MITVRIESTEVAAPLPVDGHGITRWMTRTACCMLLEAGGGGICVRPASALFVDMAKSACTVCRKNGRSSTWVMSSSERLVSCAAVYPNAKRESTAPMVQSARSSIRASPVALTICVNASIVKCAGVDTVAATGETLCTGL